jgi:hypothetical protein
VALKQPVAMAFALMAGAAVSQQGQREESFLATRKAVDVYRMQGSETLYRTAGCQVHALLTPSRLSEADGRTMLVFGAPELARCRLTDRLHPAHLEQGRYTVRLTLDGEDWYGIDGTQLRLKTIGCERLANNEAAVLMLRHEATGVVEFITGNACQTDGVYSAAPASDRRR